MNEIVVLYDVSNDKIRNKIVKILDGYGVRIQKSVYKCFISNKQYKEVKNKLLSFKENVDSIILLELRDCNQIILGKNNDNIKENFFKKDLIF